MKYFLVVYGKIKPSMYNAYIDMIEQASKAHIPPLPAYSVNLKIYMELTR